MKLHEVFLHLFTPRHTNNHRAKILHSSGLTFCIVLLLFFQLSLSFVHSVSPSVLGYASNINVSDLLNETNARRSAAGVGPLSINGELTNAAAGKASDMFANQYWAHTSPQGKEPWAFITGAGYNYVFAGENLARDFGDSRSVVDAWMNSPSHRENLLNSRFQDVGFAVLNGKYGDSETTLVVQEFGARSGSQAIAADVAPAPTQVPTIEPTQIPTLLPSPSLVPSPTASPTSVPAAPVVTKSNPPQPGTSVLPAETQISQPKFDILALTRNAALGLTLLLIGVMVVDAVLVYRRGTIRVVGHNSAHMLMLLVVLAVISILGRGLVL